MDPGQMQKLVVGVNIPAHEALRTKHRIDLYLLIVKAQGISIPNESLVRLIRVKMRGN